MLGGDPAVESVFANDGQLVRAAGDFLVLVVGLEAEGNLVAIDVNHASRAGHILPDRCRCLVFDIDTKTEYAGNVDRPITLENRFRDCCCDSPDRFFTCPAMMSPATVTVCLLLARFFATVDGMLFSDSLNCRCIRTLGLQPFGPVLYGH